jgi:hypothetical protein
MSAYSTAISFRLSGDRPADPDVLVTDIIDYPVITAKLAANGMPGQQPIPAKMKPRPRITRAIDDARAGSQAAGRAAILTALLVCGALSLVGRHRTSASGAMRARRRGRINQRVAWPSM